MAHFISFIFAVTFSIIACEAAVNDTQCLENLQSFGKCMKKGPQAVIDNEEKRKQSSIKIQKCFIDNKCSPPADFDADPFANSTKTVQAMSKLISDSWEKTPDNVRKCLKHGFHVFVTKRLDDCLTKNNVEPLKVNEEDASEVFKTILTPENSTGEDYGKGHRRSRALKKFFNIFLALNKCAKEKGIEPVRATMTCVNSVKAGIKAERCTIVNGCMKDTVSDACQKRDKEVKQALCTCEKNKLIEVDVKLTALEDGKPHSPQDFQGLHDQSSVDRNETLAGIRACYTNNKVEPPTNPDVAFYGVILAGHSEHKGPLVVLPLIMGLIAYDSFEDHQVTPDEIAFVHQWVKDFIASNECGCD